MTTDPIADFLTRIRNASSAGLKMVEIPGSNIKRAMAQILFDQGFILNYKFEEDNINRVKVHRLDVDTDFDEASKYGIRNIPTIIIVKNV